MATAVRKAKAKTRPRVPGRRGAGGHGGFGKAPATRRRKGGGGGGRKG